jgi:hypothetical protein
MDPETEHNRTDHLDGEGQSIDWLISDISWTEEQVLDYTTGFVSFDEYYKFLTEEVWWSLKPDWNSDNLEPWHCQVIKDQFEIEKHKEMLDILIDEALETEIVANNIRFAEEVL